MNGYVPHHAPLLEYKIKLTDGRYAVLILPEDLSHDEAARLNLIVASVAGAYQTPNEMRPNGSPAS